MPEELGLTEVVAMGIGGLVSGGIFAALNFMTNSYNITLLHISSRHYTFLSTYFVEILK